jgi:RsiW-degrading membrane proteinase PrsW (M82 family)
MTETPPPATPAPAVAAPNQTLSLISFIAGIVGVLFLWLWPLAFLPAVAAVVLGFLGRNREKAAPKWMALIGIIAGFVGVVYCVISFVYVIVVLVLALVSANTH